MSLTPTELKQTPEYQQISQEIKELWQQLERKMDKLKEALDEDYYFYPVRSGDLMFRKKTVFEDELDV